MSVNINTKKLASFALIALMAGGLLGSMFWNYGGIYVPKLDSANGFGLMQQFTSYEALMTFLDDHQDNSYRYPFFGGGWLQRRGAAIAEEAAAVPSPTTGSKINFDSGANIDYSDTNIQVKGVDEGDTVKTDGQFIYLAKNTKVQILKAYPAQDAEIISTIEQGFKVQDLDVTDRAKPEKDRELTIDGIYFDSRLIEEYLYFIIQNPAYLEDDKIVLPTIREGKEWTTIEATEIWYPNNTRGWLQYNIITSLNIQNPDAPINRETFLLDTGTALYVSQLNLYIVGHDWTEDSTITKIGIQDGRITFKANTTVAGHVLNQFSMDEYQGYFRIATTQNTWSSETPGNNVYIFNKNLEQTGRLEGLAPGEQIYSARFMGKRCYLVTFKKVDPLFTIDLSNPENPQVLGKLKIPGFSNYLHPYDENILIGLGKETTESEYGDFAWHQGIKISLFDVRDVENPRELAKIEVGNRGSDSPALYDHHAFLFNRERNLLVIPILEAQIDESKFAGQVPPDFYGDFVYQGAYIFKISQEGIELRGRVTHIDNENLLKSGYWFSSEYEVERSLYIEDNLYTISQGKIKINNLNTLEEITSVELGE
jgi:uncharacterized secreted protein with C-terminal beta-propeller domain